jgi:hypothetical protein
LVGQTNRFENPVVGLFPVQRTWHDPFGGSAPAIRRRGRDLVVRSSAVTRG